jgi:hypothetical protein
LDQEEKQKSSTLNAKKIEKKPKPNLKKNKTMEQAVKVRSEDLNRIKNKKNI